MSCLQKDDFLAVEQMLRIYHPPIDEDWIGCNCCHVTSYAVKMARRVANNIHKHLIALDNFEIEMRGNEKDFNISTLTITEKRVLDMAIHCAKLLINPDDGVLQDIRQMNVSKDYYNKLVSDDPMLIRLFREFIVFNALQDHNHQHIVKKTKTYVCC
jgi:hypothetical protein